MSYLDDFWDQRRKLRESKAALSPEQKKAAEERLLSDQRQKAINYKKFFGEEFGRSVMLDLMNKHHVLSSLPDTSDPLALARAEGRREVVLELLQRANVSMEQLDKMLKGDFV